MKYYAPFISQSKGGYMSGSQDEKWFVFRCVLLHATVFFFSDTPTGERGNADKSPSWSRSNSSVKKPWECHQFEAACSISKMNVHWNRYSHSTKIHSNQECPNKSPNMGNCHRSKYRGFMIIHIITPNRTQTVNSHPTISTSQLSMRIYNHVFLVGSPAWLKHNFSATSI